MFEEDDEELDELELEDELELPVLDSEDDDPVE